MNLAECYQILNLRPGAAVEEIEFAFSKQMMVLIKEGRKTEKDSLKAAYHQLKDHVLLESANATATEINSPEQQIITHLDRLLQPQQIHSTVRFKRDNLQIQLQAEHKIDPKIAPQVLKHLQQLQLNGIKIVSVYEINKSRSIAWKQEFELLQSQIDQANSDLYSFNNIHVNRFALPIAFSIAVFGQMTGLSTLLLLPMRIWIHEFGHATVAWLAGHRATPLPFGWTNTGEERSTIVYLCLLALLLLLFWSGWREHKKWTMGIAVGLAISQFYMTWLLPMDTYETWLSFGGVGGEFYLSTLLMVCFYFPLPHKWRWDFWRYPILLIAVTTFTHNFWLWHQIKRGTSELPWGTMFGGQGDSGGDMNRLIDLSGWSASHLINTYAQLGNFCLFLLIGVYGFGLLKSFRSSGFRRQRG